MLGHSLLRRHLRETLLLSNKSDLNRLTTCSLILLGQIFLSIGNTKVQSLVRGRGHVVPRRRAKGGHHPTTFAGVRTMTYDSLHYFDLLTAGSLKVRVQRSVFQHGVDAEE